ncbi:MAG TPA: helix-turn-helix transcriptional regulator [Verrucomicrobiae bacterium]|nr:helix-turn-helix transcriptional regulator [Verrucomicrobiae bacterium]
MQVSANSQGEIGKKLQIFSERLRARRHRLGFSQETLALKAGASPRSIVAWESGSDNIPQGIKLSKLAQALDVEIPWLLGEERAQQMHDKPPDSKRASDSSPYSWMEILTLEKTLNDLTGRLHTAAKHERKHIIGNLVDVINEIEARELSSDASVDAGTSRLLKKVGADMKSLHGVPK